MRFGIKYSRDDYKKISLATQTLLMMQKYPKIYLQDELQNQQIDDNIKSFIEDNPHHENDSLQEIKDTIIAFSREIARISLQNKDQIIFGQFEENNQEQDSELVRNIAKIALNNINELALSISPELKSIESDNITKNVRNNFNKPKKSPQNSVTNQQVQKSQTERGYRYQ